MSMSNEVEDLVEIGELKGRKVTVYPIDFDEIEGTVHSITNHGILIKTTKEGNYELYPWWQVKLIVHQPKKTVAQEISSSTTKMNMSEPKEELEIVESNKTKLNEEIMNDEHEDYDWDWEDTEETRAEITDDEGDTAILVDFDTEDITVYYEKDLDLAKSIAKRTGIKKIIKEYE